MDSKDIIVTYTLSSSAMAANVGEIIHNKLAGNKEYIENDVVLNVEGNVITIIIDPLVSNEVKTAALGIDVAEAIRKSA